MKLIFETPRLFIRPYELKDYEGWKKAYGQMKPAQTEWDINPRSIKELSKTQFRKILLSQNERRRKDQYFDFAVFLKSEGELIGTIALMDIARGVFQNAYLGYRLFNNYWNQGYGKEMVRASFKIGFQVLKLHRLEAGIDPKNRRSIFLVGSVGMRKEGCKKRALFLKNKWQDIVIYSMTCEDLKLKFSGDTKSMSLRFR
jgi:ribosomal-protein-alanine N-acetyltransferase